MTSWFDEEMFEALRKERGLKWGALVHLFESCPSTNDAALDAVRSDAPTGSLWIANGQTKGRGRRGNAWHARAGESLLLSVLMRYRGETERFMGLSLVVGLAVRDVVQSRLDGRPNNQTIAQIKWPNDVLAHGRKIAGILVETRPSPQGELGTVMGVGLNLHADTFPDALPPATSLKLLGVEEAERRVERITADVLEALERKLDAFLKQDFSPFLPELVETDYLHERRIRVGKVEGRGSGFDTAGRLLIADERGTVTPVLSGTVEVLGEQGF